MDSRLLVPATPALLDGWVGPMLLHRTHLVCAGMLRGGEAYCLPDGWYPVWGLSLDLSRAECRDRVARVLARRLVWLDGSTVAPPFDPYLSGWRIGSENRMWRQVDTSGADLDPHDDTRLPDGSRLVDALALAAVAREVLRG